MWVLYVIALSGAAIPAEVRSKASSQAQCEALASMNNTLGRHLAPESDGELFVSPLPPQVQGT